MAVNHVNPLDANIPIVDEAGRPTLEFMVKWAQQAKQNSTIGITGVGDATKFLNGANPPVFTQVKDSDLATSDITANNATTGKHGFLPKLPGDSAKVLKGDGSYNYASYDIAVYAPTVSDTSTVVQLVADRAFTIPLNLGTTRGYVSTAPTADTTFTLKQNGANIGTIVFASGQQTATVSGAGASIVAGDVLTITVGSANSIAGLSITLNGIPG